MLNDTAIKALKPRERQYKRGDSEGLFILVMPNGSKLWRFRYRFGGRQNDLAFRGNGGFHASKILSYPPAVNRLAG